MRGTDGQLEADVLADEPAQDLLRLLHGSAEREHARLEHLAPAEGEELVREFGRTLRGAAHLGHVLARRAVAGDALEREVAVAEDGGEQVVEVVRDAARQTAHRLHLLGLAELLL